jgi:hypothetical protein
MAIVSIKVNLLGRGKITQKDLDLRYILADTIESRKLGEIIEEGTGQGFFQIDIDCAGNPEQILEIQSILQSLGIYSESEINIG